MLAPVVDAKRRGREAAGASMTERMIGITLCLCLLLVVGTVCAVVLHAFSVI
jgi:hypothetical protein